MMMKTRRLANVNKEKFEETLKSAGIPGKYICRSFATWDVLLPTEELAKKLATNNINTKYFRLQPEYLGKRHIKVTVCNVSMELDGDVLAAYLSAHGGEEEEYKLITSAHGTAFGDYVFTMILDRGGFHSIPHTITYRDTMMMVVVEGRKPLCWNCKKLGHFSRSCPQKTTVTGPKTTSTTSDTMNAMTMTTNTASASTNSNRKQPEKEEGWTLVKGNKKKSKKKTNNYYYYYNSSSSSSSSSDNIGSSNQKPIETIKRP